MNRLPMDLVDEILFRSTPKSLGKMRCTNKSFEARICNDPIFKAKYLSRVGSSLLHISRDASASLCFHPSGDPRAFLPEANLETKCRILGHCSSLLLLVVGGFYCVVNPLTKKFRFLDLFDRAYRKCIGFLVDQIDENTQRFKLVRAEAHYDYPIPYETTYGFEIYAGNAWRLSTTTFTCPSSDLMKDMKPVYLEEDGALYWLREDYSILAFNPETEQARLIPVKFNREPDTKLLFGSGDNRLTMIAATKEVIDVFVLEGILTDPKWILAKRIRNEAVHESVTLSWDVVAFDGRCLAVRTMKGIGRHVVYGYDFRANKWGVVGLMPDWCDTRRYFYLLKPSWSCVVGLMDQDEENLWYKVFTSIKSKRLSSLESIMDLINLS
ncbi:unnamed protein product [Microthlaspi erraticum]|uniref:F-box associated beta-propeller type 1 domain-containing protein n=1 Tax=Microthlaspi erraticum TaxID=1685480 RepID=A0A6D2IBM2_9BRAS|nr:unnamed protein product [Microthlaspi erraticum]CAA7024286.1 unnamed protein product [Microthlaspi erraticum]CAA7062315.1 unnamed protein product [Microthlaspi erraticum]